MVAHPTRSSAGGCHEAPVGRRRRCRRDRRADPVARDRRRAGPGCDHAHVLRARLGRQVQGHRQRAQVAVRQSAVAPVPLLGRRRGRLLGAAVRPPGGHAAGHAVRGRRGRQGDDVRQCIAHRERRVRPQRRQPDRRARGVPLLRRGECRDHRRQRPLRRCARVAQVETLRERVLTHVQARSEHEA